MLVADGLLVVSTWTPYYVWIFIDSHNAPDDEPLILRKHRIEKTILFAILTIVNSCATPLIYLLLNPDYKVRT